MKKDDMDEVAKLTMVRILQSLRPYNTATPTHIERTGYEQAVISALALKLNDGDLANGKTCKEFPIADWRQLVADGNCRIGYWNWIFIKVMSNYAKVVMGELPGFAQLTASDDR